MEHALADDPAGDDIAALAKTSSAAVSSEPIDSADDRRSTG
jgi:hypothetical protein